MTKSPAHESPLRESPLKDLLIAITPAAILLLLALVVLVKFINPAPPRKIVISTGNGEGDYLTYAKLYQDIIKEDGVEVEIRASTGAIENLHRLEDANSDVDAGFVQDGLGSPEKAPDLSSLGSLYYEPIWVFYRGKTELQKFSQFAGKKIAVGERGGGIRPLIFHILKASGVDEHNSTWLSLGLQDAVKALRTSQADIAVFLATPDDDIVKSLVADPAVRLMSVDQAEAITRQFPYLHHLVLPHGAIDLERNLPAQDMHLVSPTATLLVKDKLHPALQYLLLKAAAQVHAEPGIFERKGEFPIDKDYQFPLSDEAKNFYKSGAPFWQRYLPFWLAILVDRFLLLVIPALALLLPVARSVPRFMDWRVRSRIYRRYGELKFLETQAQAAAHEARENPEKSAEFLQELDRIEERVNHMKVPLDFSDHIYVLREHINFVRGRIKT